MTTTNGNLLFMFNSKVNLIFIYGKIMGQEKGYIQREFYCGVL